MLKPGEERLANFYLRLQPDALLIRSAGMLQQMNPLKAQGVPPLLLMYRAVYRLVKHAKHILFGVHSMPMAAQASWMQAYF